MKVDQGLSDIDQIDEGGHMSFKILVVEGNEIHALSKEKILTDAGYEVLRARNGAEGVDKAALEKPDLIIMDLRLSKIDGANATKQIKHIKGLKEVPIIGTSEEISFEDEINALDAGCCAYLRKPVIREDLLDLIDKMLVSKQKAG